MENTVGLWQIGFGRWNRRCKLASLRYSFINHSQFDLFVLQLTESLPSIGELVDENAQRPEVSGEVMSSVKNHFRSYVFRSTAECPRLVAVLTDMLGETKINL